MKYIIYKRVSTDKQTDEMQQYHCMQYIQSINKNNSPVVVYSDPDVSSRVKMDKRLGLQEMLRDIRKGDVVVVFKFDRLARKQMELLVIHHQIEALGARLYSHSEPNVQSWMLGIFASMAQKEREDIAHRVASKIAEKKARGDRIGKVRYGLSLDKDKRLVVNTQEVEVLERIEQFKRLGYTYRRIADELNYLGYTNRSTQRSRLESRDIPWTYSAVFRVIKNLVIARSLSYEVVQPSFWGLDHKKSSVCVVL